MPDMKVDTSDQGFYQFFFFVAGRKIRVIDLGFGLSNNLPKQIEKHPVICMCELGGIVPWWTVSRGIFLKLLGQRVQV
jgi:hypothetical protein